MKISTLTRYLIITVLFFLTVNLHADVRAQESNREASTSLFFAAPVVEAVMYGRTPPSIGYGFALGTEDIVSLGLKGIYVIPTDQYDLTTLEMTIFLRIYLFPASTVSGLFAQLTYGFAVFSWENKIELPADGGSFSIGITAGWRFSLGSRFFIEPYIRGGYPYYGGLGLSAGVRF